MRQLRDLTESERSAYRVWQSKLKDRTLSAEQHDQARREIDHLLWKGPNAQVLAVKAEVAEIRARLERLEFHAGLNDEAIPDPTVELAGTAVKMAPLTESVVDVNPPAPEEKGPAPSVPEDVPAGEKAEEKPKKETRGRKKLRFIPDKNANGGWMLLDRDSDEYLEAAPFKTRKDAKAITDELNAGRVPSWLRGKVTVDAAEETPTEAAAEAAAEETPTEAAAEAAAEETGEDDLNLGF